MIQNDDDVLTTVVDFIREQEPWVTREITSASRLETDIGITGDDAPPFLEAFCKRFEIKVTKLEFSRYFHSEGFYVPLLTPILYRLFIGKPMPPPPSYDLAVGDLARVARLKKWVDPI